MNINLISFKMSNEKEVTLTENIFKEDIIIVDLQNMTLSLMKEGNELKKYNIVGKGKPGSYYETPAGNYNIKSKEKNRFSGLGQVYMPYSMQFYGNFFIHGIPYYPNGKKVSSSYSGGCIRMSDADAKEIYEFSKAGTRIMILSNIALSDRDMLDQNTSVNALTVLTSLEVINQEKYVTFQNKKVQIKELNPYILKNDEEAIQKVIGQIGENNFSERKIEKANAIGISDTNFQNEKERIALLNYIKANKNYILTLLD